MHNNPISFKAFAFSVTAFFIAAFGFAVPHASEAVDTPKQEAVKQEAKVSSDKKNANKTEKNKASEAKKDGLVPVAPPTPVKPATPTAPASKSAASDAPAAPAKTSAPVTPDKKKYASPNGYQVMTDGSVVNFRSMGVIHMNGIRYSYYSSRALYHYRTPEWYACDDHIYRTADGYIVVASGDHPQGSIVNTPFGKGKVLDHCYASGTIDIYVNF